MSLPLNKQKYLKVEEHWMRERSGEIENIFLMEDGSFRHTRLVGDWQTCIQSDSISQDEAEKSVGHIIPKIRLI